MDKNRNTDWATEHIHGIPVHPVTSIFPMMTDEELNDLAEDIRANGLREPIVLAHMGDGFDDEVLIDGRNRYRACLLAGVEPKFVDLYTLPNVSADEGADFITEEAVASWILSHNLHRRHLSPSQLAAVATEFEETESKLAAERRRNGAAYRGQSATQDLPVNLPGGARGDSRDKAAEMFGVSGKSVSDAKYVKNNDPGTFEKVKAGDVAVSRAAKTIRNQNNPKPAPTPEEQAQREAARIFRKHGTEYAEMLIHYLREAGDYTGISAGRFGSGNRML